MNKLKVKKNKEKELIGIKLRSYIDFIILICCTILAFNIHPSNISENNDISTKHTMTYIFHDYAGNEYIMNDKVHGAPSSWDYLFNDEVPHDLKGDTDENNPDGIKDNQISINDVMTDLGVENENNNSDSDTLVIFIGGNSDEDESDYIIKEQFQSGESSSLTIERIDDGNTLNEDNEYNTINDSELVPAKAFTFIKEGRVLPTLASRTDLYFDDNAIKYVNEFVPHGNNGTTTNNKPNDSLPNYADCKTPWGYKIHHGESVLAYKQMDNAPDICNIERRFCWKGKLSGTYTQQGCSVNKEYTYEQRDNIKIPTDYNTNEFRGNNMENTDGSVTIIPSEIGHTSISDAPNRTYSDYTETYNIREEEPGIEQATRPHPSCTTPWGEKVKHGDFIQAFKHENGFTDAPCEAQIRLCSLGELMGTYTESSCKTRDSSFIDWVNGHPSGKTYSKEKMDRIKKQIKNEKNYYENTRKNAERSTNSEALDKILYMLDQD